MRFIHCLILIALFSSVAFIPASGQYNFTADNTEGCTPMKVKYTFTSTATADTITSFYWDFGNGETSNLEDPDTVVYSVPGTFTPALVFNSRADLMIVKPDLITVHHTVPAFFSYYDSLAYNIYVFEHTEPLDAGVTYTFNWNIETFPLKTGRRQVVQFPEADTFKVILTVSDDLGCTSTSEQDVYVLEELSVQNVFTPNDDGYNDYFMVSSNGGFPISLRIFTRAGILVYETEGTTLTWDGRTASGMELKPGIYFYSIKALEGDPNKRYSKAGVLYLYR
ncbi:MAG: gliding motility-associated C-terminal domain-containing protein [Bacteroidales bacterium]|nr:gliding motility-associated C-terminal domain-containing protein [Bacteroidales bacterium]